jgi:hypothetical protein
MLDLPVVYSYFNGTKEHFYRTIIKQAGEEIQVNLRHFNKHVSKSGSHGFTND